MEFYSRDYRAIKDNTSYTDDEVVYYDDDLTVAFATTMSPNRHELTIVELKKFELSFFTISSDMRKSFAEAIAPIGAEEDGPAEVDFGCARDIAALRTHVIALVLDVMGGDAPSEGAFALFLEMLQTVFKNGKRYGSETRATKIRQALGIDDI